LKAYTVLAAAASAVAAAAANLSP